MLIAKENGRGYTAGPLDILCILKLPAGTFHCAFFEESPLPGPVLNVSETTIVRLKSKMHHTQGAETFEEAQAHLKDLSQYIEVPEANIIEDVAVEVEDAVNVWILDNWTKGDLTLKKVVEHRMRLATT